MATVSKNDPDCVLANRIIFVGNVQLRNYEEQDALFQSKPATLELVIDVIAPPGYELIQFKDIVLLLEILQPVGSQFVEHSGRNNYLWGVPHPSLPNSWVEVGVGAATPRLRIRTTEGNLLSGPNNGATYFVGIAGVPADGTLQITAFASANQVLAIASSCAVTISDLRAGERLVGYLPSPA